MTMSPTTGLRALRFTDQPRLHRAALAMCAAGALAALAAHLLFLLDPRVGGLAAPLPLALVAAAALHRAAPRAVRARPRDLALVVLGASAAAFALAAVARGHLPAGAGLALYAAALALVAARGLGRGQFWATAAAAAAAALLARFAFVSIASAAPGPPWATALLAGTCFAAAALFGVLPRHITAVPRPRGEAAEILGRARALLRQSQESGDEPTIRAAIQSEVARLTDVADRWQALDRQASSSPTPASLVARLDDLDRRITTATDPVARAQFEKAQSEIAQQLRAVESMRQASDRVLAGMHHSLAALERMRLGAVGAEMDCASHALLEAEEIMHALAGPPSSPTG
jgi:hypothetical protein